MDNDFERKTSERSVENTSDLASQMVDGIVGRESENPTEKEKETRHRLYGRAMEYLMFADDE
ncbi:MAG: hypothetical protein ACI4IM_00575 [Acutalibacteraceae bacterium]